MSARILTNKEKSILQRMGFNTYKIAGAVKRQNDIKTNKKRKKRYVYGK